MTKAKKIMQEKQRKLIGENMLLAIGINKYIKEEDWLDNCESDAKKVYLAFQEYQYLSMNAYSRLILSGEGKETKKGAIQNALSEIEKHINDNTNFVFYYSGHGCMENGTFYFYVSDSNESVESMLSLDELLKYLTNINEGNHGNITILIDACCEKTGNKKGLREQSNNYVNNYLRAAKGIGVIFSCSEGEYALDCFNDQEVSVFTSFLLDALKGQSKALDGNYLTFRSMFNYIENESGKASLSNIQINQHPRYQFSGTDIVYALLDDDDIRMEDDEHEIFSFEQEIDTAMAELHFQISSVSMEKCIYVDGEEWTQCPSFNYTYNICKELDKMGYLFFGWERTLNNLYHYSSIVEEKRKIEISQGEQRAIIDEIWDFLKTIPSYLNGIIL